MKNTLVTLAVGASLWAAPRDAPAAQAGNPATADLTVVARVNGDPVTRAEFQRMLGNPLTRLELQQELGVENPDPKELERLAMRKLIHRRLMLQEAGRRRIEVTDTELDRAITTLRRRFDELEAFGKWMKEQGLDDRSLFDAIRADMVTGRVWSSLADGVRITDEQARDYYEAHRADLTTGEEVRLRIIVVSDKKAATDILAALRKGASFSQLARERSVGLRATRGGDTGWVDARTLPEPLHEAVPRLKPGDVAGPLEKGPTEFFLVGLEGRRPTRAASLAEARPAIERRLLPAAQQAVVATWLSEQEKKSTIELFLPD